MAEFSFTTKDISSVLNYEVYQSPTHVTDCVNLKVCGAVVSLFLLISSPDQKYVFNVGATPRASYNQELTELVSDNLSNDCFYEAVGSSSLEVLRNQMYSDHAETSMQMWKSFVEGCASPEIENHFSPLFSIMSSKLKNIQAIKAFIDVVPSLDMLDFNYNIGHQILLSVSKRTTSDDDMALCSVTVNRKVLVQTELKLDEIVERVKGIQSELV